MLKKIREEKNKFEDLSMQVFLGHCKRALPAWVDIQAHLHHWGILPKFLKDLEKEYTVLQIYSSIPPELKDMLIKSISEKAELKKEAKTLESKLKKVPPDSADIQTLLDKITLSKDVQEKWRAWVEQSQASLKSAQDTLIGYHPKFLREKFTKWIKKEQKPEDFWDYLDTLKRLGISGNFKEWLDLYRLIRQRPSIEEQITLLSHAIKDLISVLEETSDIQEGVVFQWAAEFHLQRIGMYADMLSEEPECINIRIFRFLKRFRNTLAHDASAISVLQVVKWIERSLIDLQTEVTQLQDRIQNPILISDFDSQRPLWPSETLLTLESHAISELAQKFNVEFRKINVVGKLAGCLIGAQPSVMLQVIMRSSATTLDLFQFEDALSTLLNRDVLCFIDSEKHPFFKKLGTHYKQEFLKQSIPISHLIEATAKKLAIRINQDVLFEARSDDKKRELGLSLVHGKKIADLSKVGRPLSAVYTNTLTPTEEKELQEAQTIYWDSNECGFDGMLANGYVGECLTYDFMVPMVQYLVSEYKILAHELQLSEPLQQAKILIQGSSFYKYAKGREYEFVQKVILKELGSIQKNLVEQKDLEDTHIKLIESLLLDRLRVRRLAFQPVQFEKIEGEEFVVNPRSTLHINPSQKNRSKKDFPIAPEISQAGERWKTLFLNTGGHYIQNNFQDRLHNRKVLSKLWSIMVKGLEDLFESRKRLQKWDSGKWNSFLKVLDVFTQVMNWLQEGLKSSRTCQQAIRDFDKAKGRLLEDTSKWRDIEQKEGKLKKLADNKLENLQKQVQQTEMDLHDALDNFAETQDGEEKQLQLLLTQQMQPLLFECWKPKMDDLYARLQSPDEDMIEMIDELNNRYKDKVIIIGRALKGAKESIAACLDGIEKEALLASLDLNFMEDDLETHKEIYRALLYAKQLLNEKKCIEEPEDWLLHALGVLVFQMVVKELGSILREVSAENDVTHYF